MLATLNRRERLRKQIAVGNGSLLFPPSGMGAIGSASYQGFLRVQPPVCSLHIEIPPRYTATAYALHSGDLPIDRRPSIRSLSIADGELNRYFQDHDARRRYRVSSASSSVFHDFGFFAAVPSVIASTPVTLTSP